jgi:hypothetical protein
MPDSADGNIQLIPSPFLVVSQPPSRPDTPIGGEQYARYHKVLWLQEVFTKKLLTLYSQEWIASRYRQITSFGCYYHRPDNGGGDNFD